ncbi:MAG: hypothetical protein CM15mP75_0140 [Flammeovirgaceae bacterium]|nr:MAG: hypothetical protein CM15mP75_0140 [Flammeovirgaceae bacterium]
MGPRPKTRTRFRIMTEHQGVVVAKNCVKPFTPSLSCRSFRLQRAHLGKTGGVRKVTKGKGERNLRCRRISQLYGIVCRPAAAIKTDRLPSRRPANRRTREASDDRFAVHLTPRRERAFIDQSFDNRSETYGPFEYRARDGIDKPFDPAIWIVLLGAARGPI